MGRGGADSAGTAASRAVSGDALTEYARECGLEGSDAAFSSREAIEHINLIRSEEPNVDNRALRLERELGEALVALSAAAADAGWDGS